jgi:Fe2+ transport system protein FeoA
LAKSSYFQVIQDPVLSSLRKAFRFSPTSTGSAPARLSDMAEGQTVRLHEANLNPQDCALLRALGLTDRCVMRICKVGEPCIVQVRATRIGLSRSVAHGIMVLPESAESVV